MDATPPTTHRHVIEPHHGWMAVGWSDLWRFRELLWLLAWRDVKVRYKQTVLGFLWAIVQPLMKMIVLTMIFRGVTGIDVADGHAYAVVLFAGILPWQLFSETLRRSGGSVVANVRIVSKVYFPRLIIPMASAGSALVDFACAFVVLVGVMAWYRVMPDASVLMLAPLVLLTVVAALGVGTLLSALTVAYRDFRYVVSFLVEMWFFVTPVIWPLSRVPEKWHLVVALNPMCGIVEGYRSALLPGYEFNWAVLGVSTGTAVLSFIVGLYVFRRLERQFADII